MKRSILFTSLLLLMASCNHFESEVPITDSSNSEITTELLGKWILTDEQKHENTTGFIEIIPFNKNEYLVQLKEYVDSSSHIASIVSIRMFESKIKKDKYLNLQLLGNKEDLKYMIYKFKPISKNRFKIYYLTKDAFDHEFSDSEKFLSYIMANYKEFEKAFKMEGIISRKINK